MKKIITQFVTISLIIILLFIYNKDIKYNLVIVVKDFIYNVIPSMFPIIFISNFIKYKILNKMNNKYLYYLSLIFSYAPSNGIIAVNSKDLLLSSIINPLYSYIMIKNIFNSKMAIVIVLTNLLINYILLFLNIRRNNYRFSINHEKNKSINEIISITISIIINILGVIIFFNIVISLFNIFLKKELLFFIEINNGFNIISNINKRIMKLLLITFLNSFGGVAIYYQIKSINNDANYKFFINKIFYAVIITILTFIIMKGLYL